MKTIARIIGILATANLIAMAAFVFWLVQNDRLDADRVREIRLLLGETIADENARLDEESRAAAQAAADATEAARFELDPVSAEEQLDARESDAQSSLQSVQRMRREVQDLQRQLARQQRSIDQQREELEQDREEFRVMRAQVVEDEGDEQFQRAIAVLQGSAPDVAQQMLQALIAAGNERQAVSYLNSLNDRQRTRVLNEWVKGGQAAVASRLLEAIRNRGLSAQAAGTDPN